LKRENVKAIKEQNESPPARGRGLKHLLRLGGPPDGGSPPARGRGLKPLSQS